MSSFKTSLLLLIAFLLIYETTLYFTVACQQPVWHDEGHYIKTSIYLVENFNLQSLKQYNEMSTPLPFLIYGLWGKIVGYELERLRILSLIVAFFYLSYFLPLFLSLVPGHPFGFTSHRFFNFPALYDWVNGFYLYRHVSHVLYWRQSHFFPASKGSFICHHTGRRSFMPSISCFLESCRFLLFSVDILSLKRFR